MPCGCLLSCFKHSSNTFKEIIPCPPGISQVCVFATLIIRARGRRHQRPTTSHAVLANVNRIGFSGFICRSCRDRGLDLRWLGELPITTRFVVSPCAHIGSIAIATLAARRIMRTRSLDYLPRQPHSLLFEELLLAVAHMVL